MTELILLPPLESFVEKFEACICYAGIISIPAPPYSSEEGGGIFVILPSSEISVRRGVAPNETPCHTPHQHIGRELAIFINLIRLIERLL